MTRLLGIATLIATLGTSAAFASAEDLRSRSFEVRGPGTKQLFVVDDPGIAGDSYVITGSVAAEGVEGVGYLEMWSVFPDGSRYFSRTLENRGPMARLTGTAAPREFALPFFLTPDAKKPVRLEVNVVLPAGGRVVVRDLRFGSVAGFATTRNAWWSARTSGWIGGLAGCAVGLFGALFGTLSSLRRAPRVAFGGLIALAAGGSAMFVVGMVALVSRQPYWVWYPLLLLGVLGPALALALLPTARRRFHTSGGVQRFDG